MAKPKKKNLIGCLQSKTGVVWEERTQMGSCGFLFAIFNIKTGVPVFEKLEIKIIASGAMVPVLEEECKLAKCLVCVAGETYGDAFRRIYRKCEFERNLNWVLHYLKNR